MRSAAPRALRSFSSNFAPSKVAPPAWSTCAEAAADLAGSESEYSTPLVDAEALRPAALYLALRVFSVRSPCLMSDIALEQPLAVARRLEAVGLVLDRRVAELGLGFSARAQAGGAGCRAVGWDTLGSGGAQRDDMRRWPQPAGALRRARATGRFFRSAVRASAAIIMSASSRGAPINVSSSLSRRHGRARPASRTTRTLAGEAVRDARFPGDAPPPRTRASAATSASLAAATPGSRWMRRPRKEDMEPYIRISSMLVDVGVNAPRVLERNDEEGFLLNSDLGSQTYLMELDAQRRRGSPVHRRASTRWSASSRAAAQHAARLPAYDDALLRREMALFPEWFCGRHLGLALSGRRGDGAGGRVRRAERDSAAAASRVRPSRLPFAQSHGRRRRARTARIPASWTFRTRCSGPVTYDLVSLLRDCYVAWPVERVRGVGPAISRRRAARRCRGRCRTRASSCAGST